MSILRTTSSYEEILERILDRGMVLDGLSSLAALSASTSRTIRATAFCSLEDEKPKMPSSVLCPPRKRDRDADSDSDSGFRDRET